MIQCPNCGSRKDGEVKDSRLTNNWGRRRRRMCVDCKARFTTYEVTQDKLSINVETNFDAVLKTVQKFRDLAGALAGDLESRVKQARKNSAINDNRTSPVKKDT